MYIYIHYLNNVYTQHRALSCYTLGAFRDCEVTSLALGECRGVRNGWVRELLGATPCGRFIVTLDLSSCTGLTDTYGSIYLYTGTAVVLAG